MAPQLSPIPCRRAGCAELVDRQWKFCPRHRTDDAERSAPRGTRSERGYDNSWLRLRRAYLQRHPMCQVGACKDRPITERVAVEVHHRVPISEAPERRLDWSNLVSACDKCHDLLTPMFGRPARLVLPPMQK